MEGVRAGLAGACLLVTACSLLVGTETRSVDGDASTLDAAGDQAAGGDAASGTDAVADAANTDTGAADAGAEACALAASCLVEAGACGQACVDADTTCRANCSGNPCKKQCDQDELTCENACVVTCALCTNNAGCLEQAACQDASFP